LITQLEANKELQGKFTLELEQQVEEKTTLLITQQEALEVEKRAKLLAEFDRKFSESELKALRSQMNPHFVFNILNTIESYSLENNKEAVSAMIQKFSKAYPVGAGKFNEPTGARLKMTGDHCNYTSNLSRCVSRINSWSIIMYRNKFWNRNSLSRQ
jgi:hypothetical protein